MRFTFPVLDRGEVSVLASHGADELYCGYLDGAWRARYGGDATISRRQGAANLASDEAMKQLCLEGERLHIPLHLTLNARVTADQIPLLTGIAERWAELGGSGIILQDPLLLSRLKHLKPMIFTVSLLAVTVNRYAAAFWRDLGADRIVLPRFLRISEMKTITEAVPDLEYEAMIFGDLCPFADGFCRSVHAESFRPIRTDREITETLETCHPSGKAYHLCLEYGEAAQDPCAACRLRELEDAGISIGKAGGRGLPLQIRLQWLDHLQAARNNADPDALRAGYRAAFGHACRCYYEERRGGI